VTGPGKSQAGRGPVMPTSSASVTHRPLTGGQARLTAGLLHAWQERNATASMPLALRQLEVAGNLANLRLVTAGSAEGYRGPVFMDSDIFPDPRLDAVRGCAAIGRGPLVYCLEQADQAAGAELNDLAVLDGQLRDSAAVLPGVGETVLVEADAAHLTGAAGADGPVTVTALPYFQWDNRDGRGHEGLDPGGQSAGSQIRSPRPLRPLPHGSPPVHRRPSAPATRPRRVTSPRPPLPGYASPPDHGLSSTRRQ
jgi:hypothetical protein